MSRTIGQLDIGTSVYIDENSVAKEYILLKKDSAGCILLRAKALKQQRINPTNTSVYENSEMDQYLTDEENGFLSLFDPATRAAIVSRSRPTYSYGDSACHWISRRAFLLTYGEMFGASPTELEPLTSLVGPLVIWSGKVDSNPARIAYNESDQAVSWWLSSPYSASNVSCVSASGTASSYGAALTIWARPALNVASATIVSDEGADKIYLLPSQAYREVSFNAKVLESSSRPSKVSVEYNAVGLYDVVVEVCNNYGDANPVWQPVTSGAEIELTNTSKQTWNWEVGLRCYGKSQGYGYFDEPIVKMAEVE